ncbi:MAG: hypothetical protein OXB91_02695, partial [Bryobacterales bacterium]|nr:hypothetical protein [Bryobacterales bacterium]
TSAAAAEHQTIKAVNPLSQIRREVHGMRRSRANLSLVYNHFDAATIQGNGLKVRTLRST